MNGRQDWLGPVAILVGCTIAIATLLVEGSQPGLAFLGGLLAGFGVWPAVLRRIGDR